MLNGRLLILWYYFDWIRLHQFATRMLNISIQRLCTKQGANKPRRLYLAWAPNTEMTPVPVRSPFLRPSFMMYSICCRYPRSSQKQPKLFSAAAVMRASFSCLHPPSLLFTPSMHISEVAGILVEKIGEHQQLKPERSEVVLTSQFGAWREQPWGLRLRLSISREDWQSAPYSTCRPERLNIFFCSALLSH